MTPAELVFEAGEIDKTIVITASEPDTYGYLTTSFVSTDLPAFYLVNTSILFNVEVSNDDVAPVVQDVRVSTVKRRRAKI